MANYHMARFVTEVAPPQFVSVIRHRASKMLDTINEEEREVGAMNLQLWLQRVRRHSHLPSSASSTTNSNYFLKEVHRTLSVFGK